MLNYTKEELLELGAEITTREIYQQPDVWKEAFEAYQRYLAERLQFLHVSLDRLQKLLSIHQAVGRSHEL